MASLRGPSWRDIPHAISKDICMQNKYQEKKVHKISTAGKRRLSLEGIRSSIMDGQRRPNDSLDPIGLLLIHFIIEMDRFPFSWLSAGPRSRCA